MTDLATPNLPARDMDVTLAFYQALGFERTYGDPGWMILKRGELVLEFFAMPQLKPKESWFSACWRVDDLDAVYAQCASAGLPDDDRSIPRLSSPRVEDSGIRIFYLIDPNGTLIRCLDNATTGGAANDGA